jgi:methyl-accepting chemotaxis protein
MTMKLKTKLGGLVAILLAMILFVTMLGWNASSNSGNVLTRVANSDVPLAALISETTTTQLQQSIWLYRGLLGGQLDSGAAVEEAAFEFEQLGILVAENIQTTKERLNLALEAAADEEETARIQQDIDQLLELDETYVGLREDGRALLDLLKQGDFAKAELRLPMVEIDVEDMSAQLLDFNAAIGQQTSDVAVLAAGQADDASRNMLMLALVAFGLSLFMGYFIVRSVGTQLGADPAKLLQMTEALAEGRLVMDDNKGQLGVYKAINRTMATLRIVIESIKSGTDQVATASQQVLQGNTDLSSRTQEQASSLEEVAASMEEMAGTVNQNAENAQQAEKLAKEAQDKAGEGSLVVSEAVTAMDMIDESSSRITEILEMIEEIAFQTNLLALNAAVEAARAGEQGRGFAVVANEVRNLAGRSSKATKDIKSLIQESQGNVANGMTLVNNSGAMLHEIVSAVKGVSEMVSEIAAASVEQSDGIAQVNKAVIQMEGMTQQNAALVEEAAAASQSMGDQAHELNAQVAFFRLDDDGLHDEAAEIEQQDDSSEEPAPEETPEQAPAPVAAKPAAPIPLEPAHETSELTEDNEWSKF